MHSKRNIKINNVWTYDLMMYFRYSFLSLSTNQSIRQPAINGAVLYSKKNLCRFPVAHARLVSSACLIYSFFLSSLERNWKIVVKSKTLIGYVNFFSYKIYVHQMLTNWLLKRKILVWIAKLTQGIFCEDIIQYPISGELGSIYPAIFQLSIKHLQLSLTLIELLMVASLEGYPCMCFIHLHCKQVPHTLHLKET